MSRWCKPIRDVDCVHPNESENTMSTSKKSTTQKILLVLTSHDRLGTTGERTGFWLEELAAPYYELEEAGFSIDLASPKGGRPPVDPKSEKSDAPSVERFLADPEAMTKLETTLMLETIDPHAYDAYFVVGGHGV